MNLHEYQAKALLSPLGIPTLPGEMVTTVADAVSAAEKLAGSVWAVKAQIHAGGRGKAGGVKIAHSLDEVKNHAQCLLGHQLVTQQTGPKGKRIEKLYIEAGAEIVAEFYVAVLVDRQTRSICLMASASGGMEIEEVAQRDPDAIHRLFIDPKIGLVSEAARAMALCLGVMDDLTDRVAQFFQQVYQAFVKLDASMIEVNPMAILKDGRVVALDAKMLIDDNALVRHPDIQAMRDESEEDPLEIKARHQGLNYIALDGDIACMVNGAGLAMATMDAITQAGAQPANFLDVGGGASVEKVKAAFEIMLSNPRVKAILINIFGGIMQCDTIASGIVAAANASQLKVPLVVRMNGSREEQGRAILAASGLHIIPADDLAQAAQKVVASIADKRSA